jgi:hypothetical protein
MRMRQIAMRVGALLIAAVMLPVSALAQSQLVIPQVTVTGQLQRWTGMTLGGKFVGTVAIVDASGNQITSFGGSGGTASNFGSAFPSSGTAAGWSDGTNMQGPRVFDADTGAGTQYVAGTVLRKSASGGSVEAGTSSDPLRVDPTGSTTQPVSGTVTANQGGTWTVQPGNTANTTPWLQIIRDAAGNARGANVDASNRLNTAPSLVSGSVASGAYASGSVASGAYASGSIASGAMVDLGAQADAACSTDTGTCSLLSLQKRANQNLTAGTIATGTAGTPSAVVLSVQGVSGGTAQPVIQSSQYPVAAVPYTATATGTTGATTATLTGAASVTTYICGFSIRANATAAVTGNATVTGVITATLNFTQWTAPAASGLGITEMIFAPCIPASAANTSIAVVSAAPGTGGVVSVTAWGYKL